MPAAIASSRTSPVTSLSMTRAAGSARIANAVTYAPAQPPAISPCPYARVAVRRSSTMPVPASAALRTKPMTTRPAGPMLVIE